MTQQSKTIAEMVKELDEKFDGVVSGALDNKRSYEYNAHKYYCIVQYHRTVFGESSLNCDINGVMFFEIGEIETYDADNGPKSFTLDNYKINEAIQKAHDYFIVKGGEL